jgi:hypothetical protein
MTLRDKLLYHHAHPAKVLVDVVCAFAAGWLFWGQHLLRAAAVGLVPPAMMSLLVLQFVDLERVKQSALGRYVGRHMSLPLHITAVAGVVVFWLAAWYRSIFYCVVGLLIITFAWVRGPLAASSPKTRTQG